MSNFSLIGAAMLSLMLAAPAMAAQHSYRHHTRHYSQRVYGAYARDRGYDFVPGNTYGDFDRKNTFN
jgi:hypothetical protein